MVSKYCPWSSRWSCSLMRMYSSRLKVLNALTKCSRTRTPWVQNWVSGEGTGLLTPIATAFVRWLVQANQTSLVAQVCPMSLNTCLPRSQSSPSTSTMTEPAGQWLCTAFLILQVAYFLTSFLMNSVRLKSPGYVVLIYSWVSSYVPSLDASSINTTFTLSPSYCCLAILSTTQRYLQFCALLTDGTTTHRYGHYPPPASINPYRRPQYSSSQAHRRWLWGMLAALRRCQASWSWAGEMVGWGVDWTWSRLPRIRPWLMRNWGRRRVMGSVTGSSEQGVGLGTGRWSRWGDRGGWVNRRRGWTWRMWSRESLCRFSTSSYTLSSFMCSPVLAPAARPALGSISCLKQQSSKFTEASTSAYTAVTPPQYPSPTMWEFRLPIIQISQCWQARLTVARVSGRRGALATSAMDLGGHRVRMRVSSWAAWSEYLTASALVSIQAKLFTITWVQWLCPCCSTTDLTMSPISPSQTSKVNTQIGSSATDSLTSSIPGYFLGDQIAMIYGAGLTNVVMGVPE